MMYHCFPKRLYFKGKAKSTFKSQVWPITKISVSLTGILKLRKSTMYLAITVVTGAAY